MSTSIVNGKVIKYHTWPQAYYTGITLLMLIPMAMTTVFGFQTLFGCCTTKTALMTKLNAITIVIFNILDIGSHLPIPAHWPHTAANILLLAFALINMYAPASTSHAKLVAVAGITAAVYSDLMQAANIMWCFGILCTKGPEVRTVAYWLVYGGGLQIPNLIGIVLTAYWACKDRPAPGATKSLV